MQPISVEVGWEHRHSFDQPTFVHCGRELVRSCLEAKILHWRPFGEANVATESSTFAIRLVSAVAPQASMDYDELITRIDTSEGGSGNIKSVLPWGCRERLPN